MSQSKLKLFTAFIFLLITTIVGTIGLTYFENWSFFNALWVTLVSLTTTGYGDLLPSTLGGRIFLLFILISGIGTVAYSLGTITNLLIEGTIFKLIENNTIPRAIGNLKNHIIVCGAGRVGSNVAAILKNENTPYLLIDINKETVSHMKKDHLIMFGDATKDDILMTAGITRAQGIVCALPEDAQNLFITLSARHTNPKLKIVARAEEPETVNKLYRAGADKVITPAQLGGFRLAMAMLKPETVDLVDTLFRFGQNEMQLEALHVTSSAQLAGHTIKEAFTGDLTLKVTILAIIRDTDILLNIRGEDVILAGDTLIIIGSKDDLKTIEAHI